MEKAEGQPLGEANGIRSMLNGFAPTDISDERDESFQLRGRDCLRQQKESHAETQSRRVAILDGYIPHDFAPKALFWQPNHHHPIIRMQIQRLNMDNSWLIHIGGISLLVDPWLEGVEVDYFSWFNTQWHRTPPIAYADLPSYDWVLITQKYPDHYHKKTLLKLQPNKILVPASIEKSIKKLLPEAEVVSIGKHNKTFELGDVKITWYPTNRKIDPIYDAFMVQDNNESVFLATHGYDFEKSEVKVDKPVTLLISPFNEFKLPFFLGGMVSPGLDGLMQLTKHIQPKHIVATHDEDKHAKGLVIQMAKIKRYLTSDLNKIDLFKDRILHLPDYQQVSL